MLFYEINELTHQDVAVVSVKVLKLNKPDSQRKRFLQRDDAYWSALLVEGEALSPDEADPIGEYETELRFAKMGAPSQSAESRAWLAAQKAYTEEELLQITPISCNKGGLLVEWQGLSGFIPASQLNDFPNVHIESLRLRELQRRQHKTVTVRVIEVNPTKNRLIFSERAALAHAHARRNLWDDIKVGDVRTGVITNMANFGAFVDLGGVEGLIHISELSWSRLTHPNDVVSAGQKVSCLVLEIDRVNGRVALSLKRMRPDPWHNIDQRYQPGQIIEGEVNNVVQYGAFVTIEEQLEGLIHISELAEGNFLHPLNVVRKGDVVRAQILSVSAQNRRIALTLRGVSQEGLASNRHEGY